jgi:hypothetical protein
MLLNVSLDTSFNNAWGRKGIEEETGQLTVQTYI